MDPAGGAPVMELPPPNWWRKVYQAMELSDEQGAAAVMYRNHMLQRMGDTLRARRDIYMKFLRRQEGPCPELFVEVCGGTILSLLSPMQGCMATFVCCWARLFL